MIEILKTREEPSNELKALYETWVEQKENSTEVEENRDALYGYLKGFPEKDYYEVDDLTGACFADYEEQGFYAGFKAAVDLLSIQQMDPREVAATEKNYAERTLSRKFIHELVDAVLNVEEKTDHFIRLIIGNYGSGIHLESMKNGFDPDKQYDFFEGFDKNSLGDIHNAITYCNELLKENSSKEAATSKEPSN